VNLAAGLTKQASIAVVDADPQGSALQWHAIADDERGFPVYEASSQLANQASELLNEFEYVIIDCPPSVHAPQTSAALQFGDMALIPVQPSPVDLWATVHIEQAVARAHESNPALRPMLVINQLELRTTLSRLVRDVLTEIALPVANTALRRRAVYRNSALEGKSVFDMGRRGADAADELEQLIREILTP
jgi:chromosome partitioning protein